MTKIMYIHDFGSSYNETDSSNIEVLMRHFDVCGISYDYTATANSNLTELLEFARENCVNMIVGISLGGWYAAHLGVKLNLPVVLINPCVNPNDVLSTYVGDNKDCYGNDYTLSQEAVDSYKGFRGEAFGIVLLDEGDEVINHNQIDTVDHNFKVFRFEGGSHRFDHMEDSIPLISAHARNAEAVFGSCQKQ